MAEAPRPAPEDLPTIDWTLGQSDRTSTGCLWALIALVAFSLFAPFGGLLRFGEELLSAATQTHVEGLTGAYCLFVGAIWCVLAMIRFFNPGKLGWWGRLTHRLMDALPHAKARLRAPTTVLPGFRPRLKRQVVLLFAPLRLVLVSRGWQPWVLTGGLAMATALVVIAGPGVFLTQGFWLANVIVVAGLGRRIAVQPVAWIEIEGTTVRDGALHVDVAHGPLHPGFELLAEKLDVLGNIQERIDAARSAGGASTDDVARDLAHLEDAHADD